uniref:DNA-directed RNA polymerase n=1 Tax=viral metagenome TaxID=1070528 RepID=A0A6C0EWQ2_9ZZZZ
MQKPDSKYASDPESASASASEDEGGDSDEEQTPKKDTIDKVKSLLGFGEEDSDNPSPKASDSETETEGDGSEDEGIEDEGEEEGEEKPSLKSGFSKLLGSLKSAVKGMGSEGASAASEVEQINVGNPSSRKGKSGATAAASSRKKKSRGVQPTQEELDYNSEEGEADEDGDGGSDNDDDGESKLKKFDKELRNDYLVNFHPESLIQNYDEIYNLARVVRDPNGVIVDNLHKTLPMLTKYEKTRILGQRAKQINNGATPFIKVPEGIIDGYLIALKELEEKKIPFIIRRPLPNRGSEYWHIEDLEIVI